MRNAATRLARLLERDGNQCALCGKPFDLTIAWPHPDSVTFDHIIPRCRRGTNELENLQLTHERCNQEKGKRVLPHPPHLGRRLPKPPKRVSPGPVSAKPVSESA